MVRGIDVASQHVQKAASCGSDKAKEKRSEHSQVFSASESSVDTVEISNTAVSSEESNVENLPSPSDIEASEAQAGRGRGQGKGRRIGHAVKGLIEDLGLKNVKELKDYVMSHLEELGVKHWGEFRSKLSHRDQSIVDIIKNLINPPAPPPVEEPAAVEAAEEVEATEAAEEAEASEAAEATEVATEASEVEEPAAEDTDAPVA